MALSLATTERRSNMNVELLRNYKKLVKEQEEFAKLTGIAFREFEKCSLRTLTKEIQPAWLKICEWSDEHHQNPYFSFSNEEDATIKDAFNKVSEAQINRKEFSKILKPYIQKVSDYKCTLTKALQEHEQLISEAYALHFGEYSELEHFFMSSQVKEIIMKFLLK